MLNSHEADRDVLSGLGSPLCTSASRRFRVSRTYVLVGINVLVFALMLLAGTPLFKPNSEQILKWGGNYPPLSLDGQWWRLFTSIFVHIGLPHILVNMWCLSQLGFRAERLYGGWSFLTMYVLTGLAASVASVARNVIVVSAGSSGAIFGLAGALIASLYFGKLPLPKRDLIFALGSLIAFAGYNLAYGFLKGGIDNGAHLGGLACGLLIGTWLRRDFGSCAESPRRRMLVFSGIVLILLFAFGLVRQMRGEAIAIESARQALSRGDADVAIRKLLSLRQAHRDNPALYSILGAAYAQKGQYEQAEACFRRVLQTQSNDAAARSSLGVLYFSIGRLEQAQSEFAKAVQLNPTIENDWVRLGLTLQRMDRHEEAVAAFQRAIGLNSSLAEAQFDLGFSEMNLRHYGAAIAAFKEAVKLSPKDYRARIWLANAYQAAGQQKEADAAYLEAAPLQPALRRGR